MKKKTYDVTLKFDNEDAAHSFFAQWLDGGGDGGGNLDWNTDKWDNKRHTWMRIKGTGCPIEWIDGKMTVMTPELEQEHFEKKMKEYLK